MTAEPHVPEGARPFLGMDVYLIDQLLKGRIAPGARILDVGAGGGRNLAWFVEQGHPVTAVEPNPEAWPALAERLQVRGLDPAGITLVRRPIERADLEPGSFDVVLCNAVLHFAASHEHFDAMLEASWRALAPGGLFFARLTSSIGIEQHVTSLGGGRFALPDGSDRYLVDEPRLARAEREFGAIPLDPLKTTVVERERAMTTWVLGRP